VFTGSLAYSYENIYEFWVGLILWIQKFEHLLGHWIIPKKTATDSRDDNYNTKNLEWAL
jgi:hypothetical protein